VKKKKKKKQLFTTTKKCIKDLLGEAVVDGGHIGEILIEGRVLGGQIKRKTR